MSSAGPPPQKSSSGAWIAVGIALGSLVLGVIVLAACGALYYFGGETLPVLPHDREFLLTAAEFEGVIPEFIVRTDAESITKKRNIDGSVELNYQYEHPDPALPVYINCSIDVEVNGREARESFVILDAAMRGTISLLGDNLEIKLLNEAYNWGDQSNFAALVNVQEDVVVGYYFIGRSERHILTCIFVAPGLSDAHDCAELVDAIAERTPSYDPEGAARKEAGFHVNIPK